jgi:protocatechuate 3,4-dioxygenase beta subunit
MKNPVALALVLVLVLGATFLAVGGFLRTEDAATPDSLPAGAAGQSALVPGGADELVGGALEADGGARGGTARPADGDAAPALAPLAIEGRVVIPAGLAPDPTLTVYCLSRPLSYFELLQLEDHGTVDPDLPEHLLRRAIASSAAIVDKAPVAADGRFRLEAPGASRKSYLLLRGRLLYLERAAPLDPRVGAEVTLVPDLGVHVRARVTTLDTDSPLAGANVRVLPFSVSMDPAAFANPGEIFATGYTTGGDGRFEVRAAPPHTAIVVAVSHDARAFTQVDAGPWRPGEEVELPITLGPGGVIRGTVVDGSGRPVQGAEITAYSPGKIMGFDDKRARDTTSDARGAFELAAVPFGELKLQADHPRLLESAKLPVELPPDGVLEGVRLSLSLGKQVAGRLVFEDGSAAAGVDVRADFDVSYMFGMGALGASRGASARGVSDAAGAFEFDGLGTGPFTLRARTATRDGEEREHAARVDGIQPGTRSLVMTLRAELGIAGRVVDEDDDPVRSFSVAVQRMVPGEFFTLAEEARRVDVLDDEGRFFVGDLLEGTWQVFAEGDGLVSPAPLEVALPNAGTDELVLRVVRTAAVRGVVVDPSGLPVPGATVELDTGRASWQQRLEESPFPVRARTDEEGQFEATGIVPGTLGLMATAQGFSRSQQLSLELAPKELREEVLLRMTRGGTIAGEVLGDDGRPEAGTTVIANNMPSFDTLMSHTGADGTFRIENVEPGGWMVIAMERNVDWSGSSGSDGPADVASMFSTMKMGQANVREGEESWVTIGAPPEDPVAVHGKVTHGGQPYTNAVISFYPEGSNLYQRIELDTVDEDGEYEVELDGAGSYVVSIQVMGGVATQQTTIEFYTEVKQVDRQREDFIIPLGRISGKVLGPDGGPAPSQRVTLTVDGVARSDSFFGGQYAEINTKADGTFDIPGLRPGTYRLSAGGASPFGAVADARLGRVTTGALSVGEDEWVDDVVLRLALPGTLVVHLVDTAGAPVPGATVFVRDANGRMLEPLSTLATDGGGLCNYSAVAPGDYTVTARNGLLSAPESAPVHVTEGGKARVELVADLGAILWLRFYDDAGEPLRATISVVDDEDREVSGMYGMQDLQVLYMEGEFSPVEHRLGPLPLGKYRVTARAGALVAEKTVRITDPGEKRMRLTLK